MNTSIIKTERVMLEPFSEKYLSEEYVAWLNDPELMKFSENRHRTHTIDSCRNYLESFENSPNFFWAITLRDSGEHIGNINAYIDTNNSVADVGLLIGEKSVQGKGYGLEAWMAVLDFLLKKQRIRKITAGTMSVNKGMLKIMQRSGMIEDGICKSQFLLNGKEIDAAHMAIFNKEYKN